MLSTSARPASRLPMELVSHIASFLPLERPLRLLCVHSQFALAIIKRLWRFLHLSDRRDLVTIVAVLGRPAFFNYAQFVHVIYLGELWSTNQSKRCAIIKDLHLLLSSVINLRRLYCYCVPYEVLNNYIHLYTHLTRLHIGSVSVVAELLGFHEVPSISLPRQLTRLSRLSELSLASITRDQWHDSWFPYLKRTSNMTEYDNYKNPQQQSPSQDYVDQCLSLYFAHINLTHMDLPMIHLIHLMSMSTLKTLNLRDIVLGELQSELPVVIPITSIPMNTVTDSSFPLKKIFSSHLLSIPKSFSLSSITFRLCKLGTSENIHLLLDLITRCHQLNSLILDGLPLHKNFFSKLDHIRILSNITKLGLRDTTFPNTHDLSKVFQLIACKMQKLNYLELASITPMNDSHIQHLSLLNTKELQTLILLRRSRDPVNITDATIFQLLSQDANTKSNTHHFGFSLAKLTAITISPQFRTTISHLSQIAPNLEEVGFHLEVLDDTRVNGVHIAEIMQEFWELSAPKLTRLVILKASGFGMDRLVREGRKRCEDRRSKQQQQFELNYRLQNEKQCQSTDIHNHNLSINNINSINPLPPTCSSNYSSHNNNHYTGDINTPSCAHLSPVTNPIPRIENSISSGLSSVNSNSLQSSLSDPIQSALVNTTSALVTTSSVNSTVEPTSNTATQLETGLRSLDRDAAEGSRMKRTVLVSPGRLERFYWEI